MFLSIHHKKQLLYYFQEKERLMNLALEIRVPKQEEAPAKANQQHSKSKPTKKKDGRVNQVNSIQQTSSNDDDVPQTQVVYLK